WQEASPPIELARFHATIGPLLEDPKPLIARRSWRAERSPPGSSSPIPFEQAEEASIRLRLRPADLLAPTQGQQQHPGFIVPAMFSVRQGCGERVRGPV